MFVYKGFAVNSDILKCMKSWFICMGFIFHAFDAFLIPVSGKKEASHSAVKWSETDLKILRYSADRKNSTEIGRAKLKLEKLDCTE